MGEQDLIRYLASVLTFLRSEVEPAMVGDLGKRRAELAAAVVARVIVAISDRADEATNAKVDEELVTAARLAEGLVSPPARPTPDALMANVITHLAHREAAARARRNFLFDKTQAAALHADDGESAPTGAVLDTATANGYLRRRFPDGDLVATGLTQLPGGKSKRTILVEADGRTAGPSKVILRQDFGVQVGGASVAVEYPLLAALYGCGLNVPKPLWLEAETNELGNPFFAMAWTPGDPAGTILEITAPAAVAADLAAFFGQLHSIRMAADLGVSLQWSDAPDPVRAMLDSYLEIWRGCNIEPCPLTEAAFAWLYDNLARLGEHRAVVHGDSSFHNVMAFNGRMTGMLDWEFAHFGDPAEDVMGCAHLVQRVMPWDEFLNLYREAGGGTISQARQDFFAILRSLRHALNSARAASAFRSGKDRDLRLAAIAANSREIFLSDVAAQLATAVSRAQ